MVIQTILTRYGTFAVDVERDKKMANALARGEYQNENLLKIMRQFVGAEDTVIDIGAHIGTFAIPAASFSRKVIAFEPSSEAATLLSRNARENNVSLQLIEKGLGSQKGTGTLIVRNTVNAGANTLVAGGNIPIVTLDSEVSHADFIKMDVEGMELEVLRGGSKLLKSARPVVVFEVNLSQLRSHGTSLRSLQCFFTQRGYWLYYPLEEKDMILARIYSVSLMTALIAPRAWLFFGESAPFDLVAVPHERTLPYPCAGFSTALIAVIKQNLLLKIRRVRAHLGK